MNVKSVLFRCLVVWLRGRYCLPDSLAHLGYISRDFVPGYSRYARYCLPGNSTNQQLNNKTTKQQDNQTTKQQDNKRN